ncbi:hypothetical protein NESM_000384600 [Novymonas esmeraldas]|uniref:JmjC domain-containing protein n=1 Tax=Novymonas esmeraldas TaxID=1808958 RepID=A0AAW0EKR3_9TRYP
MLAPSHLLRRRRGTGHVVKYLEGVPTPTKLIDHLAGADLHASAELPFFSTVPRYVDAQREHRLSRLYFHHVLYPAGGARLPYQAVVVRGGRAVRTATPHLLRGEATQASAVSPTTVAPPRTNPLTVPAAHQLESSGGSSSSSSAGRSAFRPIEDVPAASSWARADPARRPFFAASPSRSRSATHTTQSAPEDRTRSARAVEDAVLAPLRGVLERFWNERGTSEPPTVTLSERVRQLLVSPAAGLLWRPASATCPLDAVVSTADAAHDHVRDAPSTTGDSAQVFLSDALRRVQAAAAAAARREAPARQTFVYVQTRLPPTATVTLPLADVRADGDVGESHTSSRVTNSNRKSSSSSVCRMAGGVEPVVPFAVGRPITAPAAGAGECGAPVSPSDQLFAHVTCLTRLGVYVPAVKSASVDSGAQQQQQQQNKGARPFATPSSVEPWRLGGVGLDLAAPLQSRTVAEHHPTRSVRPASNGTAGDSVEASRYVVGRADAETYVLPQRELLLTLHVPVHTEDMCAAQNVERLRRRTRHGQTGHAALDAAWPTEQTRLTAARRAAGQYANAQTANKSGTCGARGTPPVSPSSHASSRAPLLSSRSSYEVRALPGDVVYIPRGWGYDVQRIVGMATLRTDGGGGHDGAAAMHICDHRRLSTPTATWHHRPTATTPPERHGECGTAPSPPPTPAAEAVRIVSAEVDALCLHYQPYPELTAAQADVYVAANYVHGGVEEFYERGGNSVYHVYQ